MSIRLISISAWVRALILLLPLLLCDCSETPPSPTLKPKHAKHATELKIDEAIQYQPDAYILHLTLADLTLYDDKATAASAAADFDIARAYTLQKQQGPILQPVAIMEYAFENNPAHKFIVVPFSMPQENASFPGMEDVMEKLADLPYTLYDMRLAVMRMPPPDTLGMEDTDVAAAQKMAEDRLTPYIKKATPLPPMAQARIFLYLTQFFMQHQSKEPAYLALDNAKQALAKVDVSGSASAVNSTRGLSREIDAQEALLHKNMPFTLNF